MKLRLSSRRAERGSILIVSLCSMMIIGLALLTYLELGKNQNQLVFRSQVWNACMPLAEAGLEDALNHCAWNSTNWISSSWSLTSSNTVFRSNTLSAADGWYKVIIDTNGMVTNKVIITSTGYYAMPGSPTYVERTLQVNAYKVSEYSFGMMSKHAIDFNGNGCKIDSYDSRDPAKSNGGLYSAAKAGDKADMATYVGSPMATYDLGNGNIWGRIFMGPAGKIKVGANGKVGSVAWQATGPKGTIQSGWFRTDCNVTMSDPIVPFSGGVPATSGTVGGKAYDSIFTSGFYQVATITGDAIVTGDAYIHVTGLVDCTMFRIQTNASARLYCASTFSFKDSDNQTLRAANFQILGLSTCKSFALDNEFMGAVYAPNAAVNVKGSKQIYGSIVADSIVLTGGADIHFDEALLATSNGNIRPFVITSWTEL